jgi:hypothetical protein
MDRGRLVVDVDHGVAAKWMFDYHLTPSMDCAAASLGKLPRRSGTDHRHRVQRSQDLVGLDSRGAPRAAANSRAVTEPLPPATQGAIHRGADLLVARSEFRVRAPEKGGA